MNAETVGYVDRLGYLYCLPCWLEIGRPLKADAEGYPREVHADTAPHNVELCERCGRPLNHKRKDKP